MAFARAAEKDGIVLSKQSFPWLCEQGHFGLLRVAGSSHADIERVSRAVRTLDAILRTLDGDPSCIREGRSNPLPGDFLHAPSRTLIELDEHQHFTSFRMATLATYPPNASLGHDPEVYRQLCMPWHVKADKYRRAKVARCFGKGGRQRQRAYYDALRDLAAPAMGHPPVIRIDATDDDGEAAYDRHRDRLRVALDVSA
jgi:hypothetical protein